MFRKSKDKRRGHRVSGFDPVWLKTHSWLRHTDLGITCAIYSKHSTSVAWVRQPSKVYKVDSLVSHKKSIVHRQAVAKEKVLAGNK